MHLFLILLLGVVQAGDPPPSAPVAAEVVSVGTLMPSYEALRLALVADQEQNALTAAHELAGASSSDPALLAAVSALIAAPDLGARRVLFGEVSRILVLRVSADPAAPKLKVYRCTMTPGYGYWLQTRAGLANPYMGTSMPDCGEEVSMRQAVAAASTTR